MLLEPIELSGSWLVWFAL